MPKHLFAALLLYVLSRGAMTALAPLYETGIAKLTSPLLMLLFIATSLFFVCRRLVLEGHASSCSHGGCAQRRVLPKREVSW